MNASFCCNNIRQHPQLFKVQHPSSSLRGRNPIQWPSAVIQTAESEVVTEEAASQSETVTRRLILLRHARSSRQKLSVRGDILKFIRLLDCLPSYEHLASSDHDRPLSKDGKVDAIKIAHKLQELSWIPELILSSDAKRTRETLKLMQEQVSGFLEAEVHFISSFYSIAAMDGQTADHLQQVICNYSRNEIVTVMCMGHNKGWEEAASMFSGSSIKLKTCNAALLEASGKSWDEAFALAGLGGWKLHGIVKPNSRM